ncbi:hypothetical protein Ppb6_02837 [Photorhabdus australis subsp. thailandensis]|uniref:HicB-like antitoxin of toxin-antitoxin system domain-containing protein n=1 Tax=Photorhabdus australis subsp. thailandensis TaxID=2805096 RepID=A0A1C0U2B6_9GAMM|nr:type II toxin-antitoxin system HicB family antitoxin [Photorhabdus australis]OCQ52043.1 hypothetical protein Ppb6_02837 [Photorhabdus australis subsp. thailandensis]
MRYPIYLHQADDGSFSGFVPDVIGCYFAGDTIDDAISDAQNALDTYFEYMSEKGEAPVQARTVADHLSNEDITMPQILLGRIDEYVNSHREYHSRSGFLAELARRELSKHS